MANSTWSDSIEDDKGGEGSGNVSSISEGASWGLSRRNTFKRDYFTERHATHGTHHAGLDSEATQQPRW